MAKKKKEMTATEKKLNSVNPVTKKKANTFTKVTNADLPAPIAKKELEPQTPREKTETRYLKRQWSEKVDAPNSSVDAPIGYRIAEPEQVSSFVDAGPRTNNPRLLAWAMGAHHAFPTPTSGPAINEPHELAPHEIPMRRFEDLSGAEVAHGNEVLKRSGVPGTNPIKALESVQMRNTFRVLSEHAAAGMSESASQKFYGGSINSKIPIQNFAETHEAAVLDSQRRFAQGVETIKNHPVFAERHEGLSDEAKDELARTKLASAIADTSPNTKYRENSKYPNIEQAEESTVAGMEGRTPRFIAGRKQNHPKAASNTERLSAEGVSAIREFSETPKTGPFRSALIQHDSPDAFVVTDIHEGSQMLPHLSTTKGDEYEALDASGNRVGKKALIHPGMKIPEGMTPVIKTTETGKQKQSKGDSRVEVALSKGGGILHKINDYTTRKVNSALGISRGVNYADNVHEMQAARWGSQQVARPDVNVSSADQYPVIRDWQAEGVTLDRPESMKNLGNQWDWMFEEKSMSPQYALNPNTTASTGDVLRSKPYLKMPGE